MPSGKVDSNTTAEQVSARLMGQPGTARLQRAIALLLLLASSLIAFAQTSAADVPLILPSAIAFDPTGNLYIAETGDHVIRRIDAAGQITTIAGTGTQGFSGDNAPATAAVLDSPQGLAADAGNLYIADSHNHRVRKLSFASGILTTIAGTGTPGFSGDNGPATSAALNLPTALALDPSGNLYIADTQNHRIRRIDAATGTITTAAGTGAQGFSGDNGPATSATIDSPTGLAASASALYLADTHNHRVRCVSLSTGVITTIAGTDSPGFSGDSGPAVTAALALPHGLTLDSTGNLYIADTQNHRIRRIDAVTGQITTVAGDTTQGFSGDNGPATAASLDTPRALTLAPSDLLTVADTSNQRIRQLDAQPAPATEIHTIAGLGVTLRGVLTLAAPSVITYGTGQITATLSTSSPATGNIVFLSTTNAVSATLATVPLVSNSAVLSTSTLPAGTYSLTAVYTGDQTNLSTQSPAVVFRIAPQPLTGTITSATTLSYGQAVPTFAATISGVLPQDAGQLTVSFSSAATSLAPVGSYPITGTLGGAAAGNYTLAVTPSAITINPASTAITFGNLIPSAASGTALSFSVQVVSPSATVLGGTATVLDGNTQLATVAISSSGVASFSNVILAPGVHTLTAVYSGTANVASSTSPPQQITITGSSTPPVSPADFTFATTGVTTQTIDSGNSATFTFTVQPQSGLSSTVSLSATGLPSLATASFNPPTVIPGAAATAVTLTVATPETMAHSRATSAVWALLILPILLGRRRPSADILALILCSIALLVATGCGDRINNGDSSPNSASTTYNITVTGTTTGSNGVTIQHTAIVTLIIQSSR